MAPRLSASSASTTQWTTLEAAPAPVSNPMKGFMPWAPAPGGNPVLAQSALPYTLEWAVFPLKNVVTGPDTYDFSSVDAMLDSIAARGHQAVIRFYVDNPGESSALPQYLIDGGTDTSRTYDFHDNEKKSFSPNYDDPNVQQMFLHFVAALGNRYDGDPRIGYITAGLYGFWGEEHTYPYNGAISSQNPTGISKSTTTCWWTTWPRPAPPTCSSNMCSTARVARPSPLLAFPRSGRRKRGALRLTG